ncbi:hypothetical protein V2O64_09865 [Verrucomicrobiaceae bacterium 227]
MLTGWATYPGRVLPQVTLNPEMILCGLGALGLALYFGHRFMKWLAENLKFLPTPWEFRYTACLSFLVLSMFGTSIAMTGIVHQAAWLGRSGSMVEMRGISDGAMQRNDAGNLWGFLYDSILEAENGGVLPDSLLGVIPEDEMPGGHLCFYRNGGDEPWLYPAAGKKVINSLMPILVSPRPNREGMIVVLYASGEVKSYKLDELPPEVAAVFR